MSKKIWTIVGAGNGGKTSAADLAIQGQEVRLFEFAEWAEKALKPVIDNNNTLKASGKVSGVAKLAMVTDNLAKAVSGADVVMVCGQANSQELAAKSLAPLVKPQQLVVLNPGSTGGALVYRRVWEELGMTEMPALGAEVTCPVKAARVSLGALPTSALDAAAALLQRFWPGLSPVPSKTVLEAGLCNANPVIHPAITLCNLSPMQRLGSEYFFYKDGVSPLVASLIQSVDNERLALARRLGFNEMITDARMSVEQQYAAHESPDDHYYEVYSQGPGFVQFRCPPSLDNCRYFHEDIGLGLVLYSSLGETLGVATPVSDSIIAFGSSIMKQDYKAEAARTTKTLGIDGMSVDEVKHFLQTGVKNKRQKK